MTGVASLQLERLDQSRSTPGLVDARFISSQSYAEPTMDNEPMLRAGKVVAAAIVYYFPKLGALVVRFAGGFFRLS